MNKKWLLYVGLLGAGYYAYRVARTASGLSQSYAIPGVGMSTPSAHPWSEALASQGWFPFPAVPVAALLAYKVL